MYVSSAQTELPSAFFKEYALRIHPHRIAHSSSRPVGGIIIDHQHVESDRKRHHGLKHLRDVLYLVECGNYNNDILHYFICAK